MDIFKAQELKSYFEVFNESSNNIYNESITEITDKVESIINSFKNTTNISFKELLTKILDNIIDFTFNFIIYFCNYGINIILIAYIILHETITGCSLSLKTTPMARFFIRLDKIIDSIKIKILGIFKKVISLIKEYKKFIFLNILLILLSTGFIYKLLVEIIIFIIVYIIKMINLETYMIIFSIFKYIFLITYPKLKYIPTFIFIPLIIILIFISAISKANFKLKKNHQRLKEFVKYDLTQTCFINGCPGTGKTLLNMSLSLACEENFIEELEQKLLDYEMKYKYLNFAYVRKHKEDFKEHSEYINTYELLNNRKSFIISNYAIYTPLFEDYSKIFNFDYMRVNKACDIYPLEEYIVISLSEFDKEYNSHDDKKIVGEDGAATFFSTVSHDLKRHAKIFVDYQLRQQVPLRIRGNSEYFITIKKRKKKYPILLFIYYLPFIGLNKLIKYLIKRYETKKIKVSKRSFRYKKSEYKRNDITLIYLILRSLGNRLYKICNWFDSFYYFKLSTLITQEDENDTASKGIKKALSINIRDLSYKNQRLYDSTFLSYSYEQKKNYSFKDLDKFKNLSPEKEELDKCNSRFYNKINN